MGLRTRSRGMTTQCERSIFIAISFRAQCSTGCRPSWRRRVSILVLEPKLPSRQFPESCLMSFLGSPNQPVLMGSPRVTPNRLPCIDEWVMQKTDFEGEGSYYDRGNCGSGQRTARENRRRDD